MEHGRYKPLCPFHHPFQNFDKPQVDYGLEQALKGPIIPFNGRTARRVPWWKRALPILQWILAVFLFLANLLRQISTFSKRAETIVKGKREVNRPKGDRKLFFLGEGGGCRHIYVYWLQF
jgi:hypothetical protein